MSKPIILLAGPFPDADMQALTDAYDCRAYFSATDKQAFLNEHGPDVRAIATRGSIGADASLIAACPNLELIAVYGVGFDGVDMATARAQQVIVTNTPDVLTEDVADLGVAMMLSLSRGINGAENWVRTGFWAQKGLYPLQRRVFGRPAGILGLGRIGWAVARRLQGFGMKIGYSDLKPVQTDKDWQFFDDPVSLATHSDFLFVTLAASEKTRHIVDKPVLNALGPDGMLVNISRASNVDETALLTALETHTLGSAALDVFEGEPQINPRFLELNNVLLQPHHASGTVETRADMGQLMRDNLSSHFAGKGVLTPV